MAAFHPFYGWSQTAWVRRAARWLWLCLLACFAAGSAVAQGIPEPGLVIYGVIQSVQAGVTNRLTTGTLVCQVTPPTGTPLVVTTNLQNINDQFSYVLIVPFQSKITGLTLSLGMLELLPAGGAYQRSLTVNGTNAAFVTPTQATFNFAPADRARQERVDLVIQAADPDVNHNGIPDWWETLYFGGPVSATADADGEGLSNYGEFIAGTNPTNSQSAFKFISVQRVAQQGFLVTWSSVTNRSYSVLRSPSVLGTYTIIRSNLPATPPQNNFTDTNGLVGSKFFYRLLVETP